MLRGDRRRSDAALRQVTRRQLTGAQRAALERVDHARAQATGGISLLRAQTADEPARQPER